jgi:ABC-type transport system substrate-binding protein
MLSARAIERTLVALATSLVVLGGCNAALEAPFAAAHPDDETPRRGGTLHLASIADIATLDPPIASDMFTSSVIRLVYAGLVDFDRNGNVVPDLASRVDEVDDGLAYRFTLRQGVRFHDGAELTASDVKRSIERALSPTTPSPTASFYQSIEGYDAYASKKTPHLEGVEVEGRYLVLIRLHERDSTFLPALAMAALRVTCPSAGESYSPSLSACGAGPFRVMPGGWERGRTLTLVRNESYFRPGLPYLDAVTWQLNASNPASQAFKFSRGEIDVVRDLSQTDTIRYEGDPRWKSFVALEPVHGMQGDSMNTEIPPFDNVEVRRAVAAAIDRDHIVMLKSSNLTAVTKPVPPGMPGYDPHFEGQRYDYAAALAHMKKAGYPFDPATGQGGWPAPIVYDLARPSLQELTAMSMQQDLAKIGLRVQLRISSLPTLYSLTHRRGKSQMSPQGWEEDFPDPSNFLEPLFSSKSIGEEDTLNYAFYRNAAVDDALARARSERDPAARARLYEQTERVICDEAPWAFEFAYRFFQAHQPYVRNLHGHPVWIADVTDVWLDRERDAVARKEAPLLRALSAGLGVAR